MKFIVLSFFIIFSPSPVYALLWWIILICFSSIYLISLSLGFLAFSYFILYIGAIVILFLFVVMTLHTFYSYSSPSHVTVLTLSFLSLPLLWYSSGGSGSGSPLLFFSFQSKDILPSLATPLYTCYSFFWYPDSLLLLISLLFTISLLL